MQCSVQSRAQDRAGLRLARTRTKIETGAERVGTPQAWPHTCLTPTLAALAASEPAGRQRPARAVWRRVDCFQQPWASVAYNTLPFASRGAEQVPTWGWEPDFLSPQPL